MKKGLIFVLFALVSIVSYSQIAWSVKAGMTMNNMTKLEDSKMKLGYTVGVGVDYAINDMWAIQSGLNVAAKGWKSDSFDEDENGNKVKYTTKFNPIYLELPILAAFKFDIADNMKFIVNAGPYLAFGLGGKASVDVPGDPSLKLFKKYDANSEEADFIEWGDDDDSSKKAMMKRFDLGLQYGIGLEFGHYLVNLSGQYGFVKTQDAYKYNKETDKVDKISPKNMSFAISVGYKF